MKTIEERRYEIIEERGYTEEEYIQNAVEIDIDAYEQMMEEKYRMTEEEMAAEDKYAQEELEMEAELLDQTYQDDLEFELDERIKEELA